MTDDALFEQAMQEVHDRTVVPAIWARALAEAEGDKVKTIARYIRLRVDELKAARPETPPPPPRSFASTPSAPPQEETAHAPAWKRFVARTIDIMWEALTVGALVGYAGSFHADFGQWVQRTDAVILGILLMPLVLLLDALVSGLFFNTPGKALLGLRVVKDGMAPISASEALQRNMRLWASGLAFGVPPINLFAMAFQGDKVRKTGSSTYDVTMNARVIGKPLGMLQGTAALLVFTALLGVSAILASFENASPSAPSPAEQWRNSVLKLETMIRNGDLERVEGTHVEYRDVRGGVWPADAVLSVENNSTWWVRDGYFFMSIWNVTDYNLRTMRVEYEARGCADSSSPQAFYVTLGRVVAPGENVAVSFSMLPWHTFGSGMANCLTVSGAWD